MVISNVLTNFIIKDNQLRAAVIVVLMLAGAYTQLSIPRSLEDCTLQVIEDAQGDGSAGRETCYKKFRNEPRPLG